MKDKLIQLHWTDFARLLGVIFLILTAAGLVLLFMFGKTTVLLKTEGILEFLSAISILSVLYSGLCFMCEIIHPSPCRR